MTGDSPNTSLAAMAPVIESKGIFDEIHQKAVIPQKTLDYRPTDKLVLVTLSMLADNQTISEVNWKLRVDKPLLLAFGYTQCPDQSTLQDTLNTATEESVSQLSSVATSLFTRHNLFVRQFQQGSESDSPLVMQDSDAIGMKCQNNSVQLLIQQGEYNVQNSLWDAVIFQTGT